MQNVSSAHKINEEESSVQNNSSEYFFILSNQHVSLKTKNTPQEFYVIGNIVDNTFVPTSKVLGQGELATTGRKGWLELNSKKFFPEETANRAITPFIQGYMTETGFIPSSREIATSP